VLFVFLATGATHLVFEQLTLVELDKGFVKGAVVVQIIDADLALKDRAVLNNFVCSLVVVFLEDSTIPLNCQERVVHKVFNKDGCIRRLD